MAANAPAPAPPPPEIHNKQAFGILEKEIEYKVELFNRLNLTCFKKCINNSYRETELYLGENSCIDRCVSKYWQVTNLVGQLLASRRPRM